MRSTLLWRSIALGLSVSLAFGPHGAAANSLAYAEDFVGGGFNFDRLDFSDPPQYIGSLSIYAITGAFIDDDFSKEYIIDYTLGNLYSIDVLTANPTLIGNVSTPGNAPKGMHWDPASNQTFLVATDASCATSTLYSLDTVDASTVEVGSTPGCIAGLAIDANGSAFGIDSVADSLVSIDTTTGAATEIGALGFHPEFAIGGFDFDPATGLLYLFAHDATAGFNGLYVVDTTLGDATLVASTSRTLLGFAFAKAAGSLFANGFDPYF